MQMSPPVDIPHYFPDLFWKLWFPSNDAQKSRIHIYHVYDNELNELDGATAPANPVFNDIFIDDSNGVPVVVTPETRTILEQAEAVLSSLEIDALETLDNIRLQLQHTSDHTPPALSIPYRRLVQLRRYLIFIRFRNSAGYSTLIRRLHGTPQPIHSHEPIVYPAFRPYLIRTKRRYLLNRFIDFLQGNDTRSSRTHLEDLDLPPVSKFVGVVREIMDMYCWRLHDAEICVGVAGDEQEFILSDCCFGSLDEGFDEDRQRCDFFFPIAPTIAIYLLGEPVINEEPMNDDDVINVSVGIESAIDVHLRNAMVLQTYPPSLIFSSLRSISLSVSSYYEFRWANDHQDYSRLRMRCRQKFMMEGIVKTLVIKESIESNVRQSPASPPSETGANEDEIRVFDLTDALTLKGEWAVAFGTFSDVWEANWKDPIEKRDRAVAVKFLRQTMVKNVTERLIKSLKIEVSTWHKLCHRNVSQFLGIFQSAHSFGMVSPWYSNGIISNYVKKNPEADRLKLLVQVASGIVHLHSFIPPIVHGDLKGGNILIDAYGEAIITDFGLSKVMEETLIQANEEEGASALTGRGASIFAGSTRWMAPELVMALVEDNEEDSRGPQITLMSDVYAFASMCLEMATDELPYAHRKTDYSVTLDIIRGILPRRTDTCLIQGIDKDKFWQLLERCWSIDVHLRPSMFEAFQWLDGLHRLQSASCGNHLEKGIIHLRRQGVL